MLICMAIQEKGVSAEDARGRIWMFDSKGLITKVNDRPTVDYCS